MAPESRPKGTKTFRRRLQEIELTPAKSPYQVGVKVLVDGAEVHRLQKIKKQNQLRWEDLTLPCDLRDDSNLTIQITEIHPFSRNRIARAVCPIPDISRNDSLSVGCYNGMFTESRLVFRNQTGAGHAYEEALTRALQTERPGGFKTSGNFGAAFKTIIQLGSELAQLDPTGGSKIALMVCAKAWEHMEALEKQDADLDHLVQQLAHMIPTIEHIQPIAGANLEDTATAILNLIEDVSLFILNYKSRNLFAHALYSIMNSEVRGKVPDFIGRFSDLREQFEIRLETQGVTTGQSTSDHLNLQELHTVRKAGYGAHRKCAPGTRGPVIDKIVSWSRDTQGAQKLFWVYGFAGLGKSSVATSVCQLLDKTWGILAASFFCKRDDRLLRDPLRLLNTIVHGMAFRYKSYGHALTQAITKDPRICSENNIEDRFKSLVETPLESFGQVEASHPLVIVIDALDEVDTGDTRKSLLTCLREMCQLVPGLKIIVTSRPDDDIKKAIGQDDKFMTSLNIADHDAADDILTFVRQRMAGIAEDKGRAEWPEDKIQQLAHRANGLFIWAEAACKFIEDGHGANKRLDQVLDLRTSPLTALDDLYAAAIRTGLKDQRRDNHSNVLDCLAAIVAISARMPLPVDDLEQLLSSSIDPDALRSVVKALSSVLYEDGDGGPVRIFHPSFADYITNPRAKKLYINPVQRNTALAICCLETMVSRLKFNICKLETSHQSNGEIEERPAKVHKWITGHLEYSCLNWYNHLSQADRDGRVGNSLKKFLFSEALVYWLEVLSLLGKLDVAVSSMAGLATLAFQSNESGEFQHYAIDIYRFVLRFYDVICESTPHLYISALPFAPATSELGKRMRPLFPKTLAVAQGVGGGWTSRLRSISHPGGVSSVEYSPDNQHMVLGCRDGAVRIWDAGTGVEVLHGHSDIVRHAVFSPNGQRIASCSDDHTIQIWDATTGSKVLPPLKGHSGAVYCVAYSPKSNGKRIVSCSADRSVRVWNAETGTVVLGPLEGHTDQVKSVAFSRDGRYIASGSDDKTVRVWDAKTGTIVRELLEGHSNHVLSVAFSSDNSLIVSGSADFTLMIWDANTGIRKLDPLRGHTHSVHSVAFSPDDHRIASGSADGTVRLWDVKSGCELVGQPRSHSREVWSVAFSPDGHRIASASADETVQIWDAEPGSDAQPAPQCRPATVNSVAISSNGRLIVSGSSDKSLKIWNVATGAAAPEPLMGHTGSVLSVAFSPDAHRIASGSADQTVRIWDAGTGTVVHEPLQGHSGWVSTVAFSPNSPLIASGSWDTTLRIWAADTGAAVRGPLQGHTGPVQSVAFSPDGDTLISGSDDKTVRLWDPKTGLPLRELHGHSDRVSSVAFSPGGKYIGSGSADGTVRIWDANTGETIHIMRGHSGPVFSVAFSHHGDRIVSCSADRTLRIWNVGTGTSRLPPLRGHSQPIRSIVFSRDDGLIVSGSDDGTILVWDPNVANITRESLSGLGDRLSTLTTSELALLANSDGWIRSDDGDLLVWLPGDYRGINDPIMCIPSEIPPPRIMVDFSKFVHGSKWQSVAAVKHVSGAA